MSNVILSVLIINCEEIKLFLFGIGIVNVFGIEQVYILTVGLGLEELSCLGF